MKMADLLTVSDDTGHKLHTAKVEQTDDELKPLHPSVLSSNPPGRTDKNSHFNI